MRSNYIDKKDTDVVKEKLINLPTSDDAINLSVFGAYVEDIKKNQNIPSCLELFEQGLLMSPETIYNNLFEVYRSVGYVKNRFQGKTDPRSKDITALLIFELSTIKSLLGILAQGKQIKVFDLLFNARIRILEDRIRKTGLRKQYQLQQYKLWLDLLRKLKSQLDDQDIMTGIVKNAISFQVDYLNENHALINERVFDHIEYRPLLDYFEYIISHISDVNEKMNYLIMIRELTLTVARKAYNSGKTVAERSDSIYKMKDALYFYNQFIRLTQELNSDLDVEFILEILKVYDCLIRYETDEATKQTRLTRMKNFYFAQKSLQENLDLVINPEQQQALKKSLSYYVRNYFSDAKSVSGEKRPRDESEKDEVTQQDKRNKTTAFDVIEKFKQSVQSLIDKNQHNVDALVQLMQSMEQYHMPLDDDHQSNIDVLKLKKSVLQNYRTTDTAVNVGATIPVNFFSRSDLLRKIYLKLLDNEVKRAGNNLYEGANKFVLDAITDYLNKLREQDPKAFAKQAEKLLQQITKEMEGDCSTTMIPSNDTKQNVTP